MVYFSFSELVTLSFHFVSDLLACDAYSSITSLLSDLFASRQSSLNPPLRPWCVDWISFYFLKLSSLSDANLFLENLSSLCTPRLRINPWHSQHLRWRTVLLLWCPLQGFRESNYKCTKPHQEKFTISSCTPLQQSHFWVHQPSSSQDCLVPPHPTLLKPEMNILYPIITISSLCLPVIIIPRSSCLAPPSTPQAWDVHFVPLNNNLIFVYTSHHHLKIILSRPTQPSSSLRWTSCTPW